MSKRLVAAIGVTALGLSACGGNAGEGSGPAPGAEGGGDGIVIGSFGGDSDQFLRESVHTFLDEYGNVDPTLDGVDAATRTTRLLTESEGDSGSWDVIAMTDRDIPEMIEAGHFQKLDPELISNWDNIDTDLVNEYCIPHIVSPMTVIYNSEEVRDDFDSWEAAFTDEFLGQSGTATVWVDYFFYASAILEAGGDPGDDLEPGYDRVADIADQPLSYGSPTQLGQGLMSGEVNSTIGPRARAAQWSSESGIEFGSTVPQEGTFSSGFYYCIPSNAPDAAAAHDYLNALLDPRGQEYFAENFFYAPTVTNVELDPEIEEAVGITNEESERIWRPDLGEISDQTPEYRQIWEDNS